MITLLAIAESVSPKITDWIASTSGAVIAVGAVVGLPIAYWQLIKWRLEFVTSKKQKTAEEVLEAVKSIELSLEHIRVPGKKESHDDRRGTRILELEQLEPRLQSLILMKVKVKAYLQDIHVLTGIDELRDLMRDLNRAQYELIEAESNNKPPLDSVKISFGQYDNGDKFGAKIRSTVRAIEYRLEPIARLEK
jgi:hypothetical protein